ALPCPHQRSRESGEGDGRPDPVCDPVRERYQGRCQPGVCRGAEEWLSDLIRHQSLLLRANERLVVDQRPPSLYTNICRGQVGVEVDSNRFVAFEKIDCESDEHDCEPLCGSHRTLYVTVHRTGHDCRKT